MVARRLTTILSADAAGYSRMMGEDEAATLSLLKDYRATFEGFIVRHRGRVVSWAGDGLLAEFQSVIEAVQCAAEVQRELGARNAARGDGQQMHFRIGITLGDVMVEGDDIFGEGVNIAARLQTLAPPGGILISGPVYEQVRNKLSFAYESLGAQQVKNIAEAISVYAVDAGGGPSPARQPGGAAVAATAVRDAPGRPVYASAVRRAGALVLDYLIAALIALPPAIAFERAFDDAIALELPFVSFNETVREVQPKVVEEPVPGLTITREVRVVEVNVLGLARHVYTDTAIDVDVADDRKDGMRLRDLDHIIERTIDSLGRSGRQMIDPATGAAIDPPQLWFAVLVLLVIGLGLGPASPLRASPGKRLFGLMVLREDGSRVGPVRALGRTLLMVLSALPLGFGYLMAFWTKRKQTLHDSIADTVVVRRP